MPSPSLAPEHVMYLLGDLLYASPAAGWRSAMESPRRVIRSASVSPLKSSRSGYSPEAPSVRSPLGSHLASPQVTASPRVVHRVIDLTTPTTAVTEGSRSTFVRPVLGEGRHGAAASSSFRLQFSGDPFLPTPGVLRPPNDRIFRGGNPRQDSPHMRGDAAVSHTEPPLQRNGQSYEEQFQAFLRANPSYDATQIGTLRREEFSRLDQPGAGVYLDYTGGSLYAERAQLEAFTALLRS
eukprot:RCo001004